MEYKIYRYYVQDSVIFIDLFNERERRNIELKFHFYRRAQHLKEFIDNIKYNYLMHSLVEPTDLIKQFEDYAREYERNERQ